MIKDWLGSWQHWWWPGLVILAAMAVVAGWSGRVEVAVYAVSFWHYAVYAMAFLLRRVSVATFKTDATLLKGVSLVVFGWAYLASGFGLASLALIALGCGLNAWAAQTLGSDRTYYGFEIGNLEAKWFKGPPFSLIAHPMLVGNMIAFGAPLLEPAFRAYWWPLAVIHVVLNFATILMETRGQQQSPRAFVPWFAVAVIGLIIGMALALQLSLLLACLMAALMSLFAALLLRRYATSDARELAKT